ncbi:adenine deaminase [Crocinitomix catalasitica]|uniref:adenine deaminase n=1 Tax=Crocinitomix catalasitica TaxID=184607 RepID=UPI00047F7DB6|nr:adenine deaminase [Crocinitomix catalasitica]
MKIQGQIVDIQQKNIYPGEIEIENNRIISIQPLSSAPNQFILPGFIDAHIHIESSMLVPSEFARIATCHGTVGTVSDPHEIANVLGEDGVKYMLDNAAQVPFHFNFGAPSCVPATTFESAGAVIDAKGIERLMADDRIKYLAEMMNYPGVIYDDAEVLQKLAFAKAANKPIDGHAPGLRGDNLSKYIAAGILTDHESFSYDEGLEKLEKGMKILIREGSAAKNYDALAPLIKDHADKMMFCSDDKHPDDLVLGHINQVVARAIKEGYDLFDVLKMACINPIAHYNLEIGQLQIGDAADFIVLEDLIDFKTIQTYINGELVAENGEPKIESVLIHQPNNFVIDEIEISDFKVEAKTKNINVIEALDGELITKKLTLPAKVEDGHYVSDIENDILKIAVINRYKKAKPAIGFIKNIGLKSGAIASTVAHDSHNIIVVGTNDKAMTEAANHVIKCKGGIVAIGEGIEEILPLPIAGIMSGLDAYRIGKDYEKVDAAAKRLGSELKAPFMTLSFMALLVIPSIKLSDFGLFDGDAFKFLELEA